MWPDSDTTRLPSQPRSDPWVTYVLGDLQASRRDMERRIGATEADHKSLKSEVEKLRTWAERAAILAILYLIGGGLHLGASSIGPVIAVAVRTLLSGRPG